MTSVMPVQVRPWAPFLYEVYSELLSEIGAVPVRLLRAPQALFMKVISSCLLLIGAVLGRLLQGLQALFDLCDSNVASSADIGAILGAC